jgi:methionine-rich copper-binding protein CopC
MKTFAYPTILSFLASAAFAHSELTASMPANNASVDAAPKQLVLHFSEPVRLTALALTRAGEAQRALGPLPAERQKDFSIASPGLSEGQYMVSWRALSADAHVMTGQFTFAVGEPAAAGGSYEGHGAAEEGHAEHGAQHHRH